MKHTLFRKTRRLGISAVAALLATLLGLSGAIALAQSALTAGTITACVLKDGTLYITSGDACKRNEILVSWPNADALQAETDARTAADNALQADIDTEADARTTADANLQASIEATAADRAQGDAELQTQVTALQATVTALQTRLDALTWLQRKTVFVTSSTWGGNLGGVLGADAKCQSLADGAGLSGTYKAWLSSGAVSARERLTHSAFPYALVTGDKVADDWADLTDGTLDHAINVDQFGNAVTSNSVWTGTTTAGDEGFLWNCSGWYDAGPVMSGGYGRHDLSDGRWTNAQLDLCNVSNRLYCFEQ